MTYSNKENNNFHMKNKMKHLDRRQIGPPKDSPQKKRGRSSLFWALSMAVIVLGAGAGGAAFFARNNSDQVSAEQKQERQIEFTKVRSLALEPVEPAQVDAALDQMRLAPPERAQIRALIDDRPRTAPAGTGLSGLPAPVATPDKPLRLATITVWDSDAEDGDVVALISGGYRREVLLRKAPVTLTIPVDASGQVKLVGVHDGGGGITLGLRGPMQEVMAPILAEGEELILPVGVP
jgi:hypothetical protein